MMQRQQITGKALGSEVMLTLVLDDPKRAEHIFQLLWEKITSFEAQFSRTSGVWQTISPEFQEILHSAQLFSHATDGLYNPFILPALQRAGYVGSWPNPTTEIAGTTFTNHEVMTGDALKLEEGQAYIPRGTALDLGGIGKGFLLDKLGAYLAGSVESYWLSLGGDILCKGFDLEDAPWTIAILDTQGDLLPYQITNTTGAPLGIATSGVIKRNGAHNGKAWHHIIDPTTQQPSATNVMTATVCAPHAVAADVHAKCLVMLGSDQAHAYYEAHALQGMLIQVQTPNTTENVVVSGPFITKMS